MLTIIIPVYNEQDKIADLLKSVYSFADEIIVADGESEDNTLLIAKSFEKVTLVEAEKGRANQMNQAAKKAKGDILVFLHADCRLDEGAVMQIKKAVGCGLSGGCLSQQILSDRFIFRLIESSGNIRAKLFRIYYGDQAIFVKKDVFLQVGGFDEVDIFEDVLFSKKLRKKYKTCILKNKVFSSARRWKKQGLVKTTFINWLLSLGFIVGVPLPWMKKIYADIR